MSLLQSVLTQVLQSAVNNNQNTNQQAQNPSADLGGLLGSVLGGQTQSQGSQGGLGDLLGGVLGGQAQSQANNSPLGGLLGGLLGGQNQTQNPNLGGLLGSVLGGGQSGGINKAALLAALLPIVLSFIQKNGGLSGVLAKLSGQGMDQKVQSWVNIDQDNDGIDAADVQRLFGDSEIANACQATGASQEQVCQGIAELLPQVVDGLTPTGDLQAEQSVNDEIDQLLAQMRQ